MTTVRTVRATLVSLVLAVVAIAFVAPPADAAPAVKISRIWYDSPGSDTRTNASLNAEYVQLKNVTAQSQNISGWTIRDAANHVYTFSSTVLAAGATLTLRTGSGTNTSTTKYWGQGNYVWNKDRDTGYLRTAAGVQVHTCSYNSTAADFKNC